MPTSGTMTSRSSNVGAPTFDSDRQAFNSLRHLPSPAQHTEFFVTSGFTLAPRQRQNRVQTFGKSLV